MTITIPKGERGRIRVFAINRPAADIRENLATHPKADVARALLGAPHLDTASTEIFPVTDLAGVGLGRYLADGYAVEAAATARDAARLDALEGYVLLLFSDSFGGAAATLEPGADLTLIGTYDETGPAPATDHLTADSAQAYTGTAPAPTDPLRRGPMGSGAVVIALVAVAALLAWWLLT